MAREFHTAQITGHGEVAITLGDARGVACPLASSLDRGHRNTEFRMRVGIDLDWHAKRRHVGALDHAFAATVGDMQASEIPGAPSSTDMECFYLVEPGGEVGNLDGIRFRHIRIRGEFRRIDHGQLGLEPTHRVQCGLAASQHDDYPRPW